MTPQDLIAAFEKVAEAPDGVKRLRELVLQLAVRGKLVPQDPEDEPASLLISESSGAIAEVIATGGAPKKRALSAVAEPLQESFDLPSSWCWTRLDLVSEYIQRGKSPKYADSSEVPIVSQKCVQWSGFSLEKARFLRTDVLPKYGPERFLRKGDLLWNSTGTGTVGRVALYPAVEGLQKVVADSHVTVVRLAMAVPSYVFCWIAGPSVQASISDLTTGTTKQQELSATVVRALELPLPPLAEQHRIVARVNELMSLLDRLEATRTARDTTREAARDAALAALSDADSAEDVDLAWTRLSERMEDLVRHPDDIKPMRQAVLQLAVQGKLVPQDPDDEPASVLLERIADEKTLLSKNGSMRKMKALPVLTPDELPFEVPTGWAWTRLVCLSAAQDNSVSDGPFGSKLKKSHYIDEPGHRVLRLGNIGAGVFKNRDRSYITGTYFNELESYHLQVDDMLVASMGNPVGRACLVPEDSLPALNKADCFRVRLHSAGVFPTFACVIMNSPSGAARSGGLKRGDTRGRINLTHLRMTPVPLPPLAEQHRIVARVDELMSLLDRLEHQLNAAHTTHAAFASAAVHHLDA